MLFAALLAVNVAAEAQTEMNNISATGRGGVATTFVRDYQAIGINPANIGKSESFISFSILEGGLRANSNAFTRANLPVFRNYLKSAEATMAERAELSNTFSNSNLLNGSGDINTLALSVNFPRFGSFAFSNRQRVVGQAFLNKNFSDLIFLGENAPFIAALQPAERIFLSEIFNGTNIQTLWLNEWNLAYSKKLLSLPNLQLYGGVGYKYIQGMNMYAFSAQNGELQTYGRSTSLLGIDYEASLNTSSIRFVEGGNRSPVGAGHGIDLGLSADLGLSDKVVKVSLALTDIGKMTWTENFKEGKDIGFTLPTEAEFAKSGDIKAFALDVAEQVLDSSIAYSPVDRLTTDLPTRLRTGIGIKLSEKVELGVDYVKPLNKAVGNIPDDFIGIGIDLMPLSKLRISSGVSTGAGEKLNLPLGIAFVTSAYEFGISTRDVTVPFSSGEQLRGSLAVGFLKFRIRR